MKKLILIATFLVACGKPSKVCLYETRVDIEGHKRNPVIGYQVDTESGYGSCYKSASSKKLQEIGIPLAVQVLIEERDNTPENISYLESSRNNLMNSRGIYCQ